MDRLWVSVDMHDNCGSVYPTPFEVPNGELRVLGPDRITYSPAGR